VVHGGAPPRGCLGLFIDLDDDDDASPSSRQRGRGDAGQSCSYDAPPPKQESVNDEDYAAAIYRP
jgi:hypothetical protein